MGHLALVGAATTFLRFLEIGLVPSVTQCRLILTAQTEVCLAACQIHSLDCSLFHLSLALGGRTSVSVGIHDLCDLLVLSPHREYVVT